MSDVEGAGLPRMATGMPGLDPLLEGGFLQGGVYLLQGPPGAGKTIFANQICFHQATEGHRALYVTLLAESHDRMISHLRRMRFFDPAMVGDRIYYLSGFNVLASDGLDGLLRTIRGDVLGRKAFLLVVDGLVNAEESSPSPREFKKFIHELQALTAMTRCTVLLLSSTERAAPFHPAYTMVDGIIELSDDVAKLRSVRHIRIRKLRGSAPVQGQHTVEIDDTGMRIRRRLESTALAERAGEVTPGRDRVGFGIPMLDEMLCGGVPRSSNTMLLGGSGTGKTMLGLQFLAEGARRGERVLHFGFYERPDTLFVKSDRLGLDLVQAQARGLLELVWQPQVETVMDVLGGRLLDAVDRFRPDRLLLDGVHAFQIAIDFPERVRDAFSAIGDHLERRGVTSLYTMETRELFGPEIEVPITGISAVTQNIFLLRNVEVQAEVRRLLAILKVRDSRYDPKIRELVITDEGIRLRDTFAEAAQVLPSTSMRRGDVPHGRKVGAVKRAARLVSARAAHLVKGEAGSANTPKRRGGKRRP